MPSAVLWAPALELCNGAATSRPEQQDSATIGRGHPPELGSEALVIRVGLSAALPGKPVDVLGARFEAVPSLELEIKLQGLLEALAANAVAASRTGAAEAFEGQKDSS